MSNKSFFFIGVGDIHDDIGPLSRIPGIGQADGVIVSGDLTIKGGVAAAKRVIEAIAALNPRIYAQIGNMDYAEVQDYLDGEGMGIHARGRELAPGVGIMGAGWSTRITSYNVCYTKLLRTFSVFRGSLLPSVSYQLDFTY